MAATTIDYYDAGMLVAFDLDVALRRSQSSLDALVRELYRAHLESGFDSAQRACYRVSLLCSRKSALTARRSNTRNNCRGSIRSKSKRGAR